MDKSAEYRAFLKNFFLTYYAFFTIIGAVLIKRVSRTRKLKEEGLRYLPYLSPEGWLVTNETPFVNIPNYPEEDKVMAEINKLPHKIVLNVDKVAKEVGSARVANIVLLGATIPFLGIDYEKVQDSIREIFLRKGEAIVEMNLKALAAGKEIAEKLMQ